MKFEYITHNRRPVLIMIFTGWSMDATPLRHLNHPDCDIACVYDYSSPELNLPDTINIYSEICIVAWSFGVPPAAHFIAGNPYLPITKKIAVNGTHHPVHDTKGIPTDVFHATLSALSENSMYRFYRRMCGGATGFSDFKPQMPKLRHIDTLATELRAIESMPFIHPETIMWDNVIISDSDLIIPTSNQLNAWNGHHNITTVSGCHLPDFQKIINSNIAHKKLIAGRFKRAMPTYDSQASVQHHVAVRLAELWLGIQQSGQTPDSILEIGAGTGMFTRAYLKQMEPHIPEHLLLWDLTEIPTSLPGTHRTCDAETAILNLPAKSLEAIAGASVLQWFNSPLRFIRNALRTLMSDGMMALSTYGPDNYREISASHYLSTESWRSIMPSELEIIHLCDEHITLTFPSPVELLRHIHLTGVNATGTSYDGTSAARAIIRNGTTSLTYHPIYMVLRKRTSK